jgi:sugar lactone lactonase YvrE
VAAERAVRIVVKPELAQDSRAMLGEGPVWDQRSGRLHWVDIRSGLVHRFSPADGTDLVIDVGQPVSAVGLGERGGLVLAIRDGFGLVPAGSGDLEHVIEVEKDLAGNRMNDGRCDPAGRFWAGTMADRWEDAPAAGALYRLDGASGASGALAATKVLDGITVANGIDWTPDGRHMYYVDSPSQQVDVFDFDVDTGTPRNRSAFVTIPAAEGLPDGLVVDADGGVWVALFGAGVLRRYSPSGRVDQEIRLPVTLVTSAAFGGPDLADLYITTARHRLTEQQRERQPQAGSLFWCRPGPVGQPAYRFAWA